MRVAFRSVTVEVGGWRACDDVTVDVPERSMTVLVGANGAGKSTLLRCLYRALRPTAGMVAVDDDDVWSLPGPAAGRRVAAVVQEPDAGFDLTVAELVGLGRIPHRHGWQRLTSADHDIVDQAIERVGLGGFEHRHVATLSGGERQRANIARAVAQQADVLVLDEPTNHLDVRHQLEILELVTSLGVTVIAALHDLVLAERYADQVLLLSEGQLLDHGPPLSTITADNIHRMMGVHVRFVPDPLTGRRALHFELTSPTNTQDGRDLSARTGRVDGKDVAPCA